MSARYYSQFPEKKITAPKPPRDKRGGTTPSVTFKSLSKVKSGFKK